MRLGICKLCFGSRLEPRKHGRELLWREGRQGGRVGTRPRRGDGRGRVVTPQAAEVQAERRGESGVGCLTLRRCRHWERRVGVRRSSRGGERGGERGGHRGRSRSRRRGFSVEPLVEEQLGGRVDVAAARLEGGARGVKRRYSQPSRRYSQPARLEGGAAALARRAAHLVQRVDQLFRRLGAARRCGAGRRGRGRIGRRRGRGRGNVRGARRRAQLRLLPGRLLVWLWRSGSADRGAEVDPVAGPAAEAADVLRRRSLYNRPISGEPRAASSRADAAGVFAFGSPLCGQRSSQWPGTPHNLQT